jgi:hypothetical protein
LHWVAPAAGFSLLSILMTWPLAGHLGDAVRDPGDPLSFSWTIAWGLHALVTHPLDLFHGNIYYPFPNSLTYGEVLAGTWPFAGPILWLTGNPVEVHNLLELASFAAAGVGAYYLAWDLTRHGIAATVAGIIFAFCPYRFAHLSHLNLEFMQWLPLLLLSLHRSLRRRETWPFVLLAIVFALQALSSFYYGFFAAIAVATFLGYELITRHTSFDRFTLTRFGLAILISGVAIVPFGIPYLQSQHHFGFRRTLTEVVDLSASIQDFLAAPPGNWLYGGLTAPLVSHTTWPDEHFIFPGLVGVALLIIGLLSPPRLSFSSADGRRLVLLSLHVGATREQLRYVTLLVVAFILALGPYLQVPGHRTSIPLPYLALYQLIPGFTAMRGAVRLAAVFQLALAICAAFGVVRLDRTLSRRRWGKFSRFAALGLLPIAAAAEFIDSPIPLTTVPTGNQVPGVYRWLTANDVAGPVAEMPSTPASDFFAEYYSVYHWHPVANGHGSFEPSNYSDVVTQINAFPDNGATDNLRALGIKYVVVHTAELGSQRGAQLSARAATVAGVQQVGAFGTDVLFDLGTGSMPGPAEPAIRLELPQTASVQLDSSAFLVLRSPSDRPAAIPTTTEASVDVQWDSAPARQLDIAMPPFVPAGGARTMAIPLGVQSSVGTHHLTVRVHSPFDADVSGSVDVRASMPTSLAAAGLAGTIDAIHVPAHLAAGDMIRVDARLTNTGTSVWLAAPPGDRGRVALGIHRWTDGTGTAVRDTAGAPLGGRASLPANVAPGQAVQITLDAPTPRQPGSYSVRLDLVSEFVARFSDADSDLAVEVPVTVDP